MKSTEVSWTYTWKLHLQAGLTSTEHNVTFR